MVLQVEEKLIMQEGGAADVGVVAEPEVAAVISVPTGVSLLPIIVPGLIL